jgi:DNA polymerase III subunit gamma/tau
LMIDTLSTAMQTPALRDAAQRSERQIEAERIVQQDPFIQRAMAELGARILPNTCKPIDPKKE